MNWCCLVQMFFISHESNQLKTHLHIVFYSEPLCMSSSMPQCSGTVYSPERWTLEDWQLSFITTQATEALLITNMTLVCVLMWTVLCCCFTGKVQRVPLLSSVNIRPSETNQTKPSAALCLCLCVVRVQRPGHSDSAWSSERCPGRHRHHQVYSQSSSAYR